MWAMIYLIQVHTAIFDVNYNCLFAFVIRTFATGYALLCACCQFVTGAPLRIPDKATEIINPPVAAAINVILSFTIISFILPLL